MTTIRGFKGTRIPEKSVTIEYFDSKPIRELDTYYPECNHSPDGFEWGYNGSGPSQLAYAILREWVLEMVCESPEKADAPGEIAKDFAREFYIKFRNEVISKLQGEWELLSTEIEEWVSNALQEKAVLESDKIGRARLEALKDSKFTFTENK